jgi:hypothetical protein
MKYINNCCTPFDGMCDEELFYWPALTLNSVTGSKSVYLSLATKQRGENLSIC